MAKSVSTHKLKMHRLYTYEEAAHALGVTAHTVRSWGASGLQIMATQKPHFILGANLIAYIQDQKKKRSVKMTTGDIYCFRCKTPRKPLWAMLDYIPITETRGRLSGLCECCEGPLHRFTGKDGLTQFGEFYEIAIRHGS